MDAAGLRDRIQATLDPNAAIRQQAELDLKHVRVPRAIGAYEVVAGADRHTGRGAARLHRRAAECARARTGACDPTVE